MTNDKRLLAIPEVLKHLVIMIYEKFPQLHSLTAEDKVLLAKELMHEASKAAAGPLNSAPLVPLRDPFRFQKLQPDWKNKERKSGV